MKQSAIFFGIASVIIWFIPILGIAVAILGINASSEAYQRFPRTAKCLSITGLILALVNSFAASVSVLIALFTNNL